MQRDSGATVFERYRIERENGCSDSGIVYDAVEVRTGKSVALEIATDVGDDDARQRLARDAMLAQRLEDEHVLRVLEAGILSDGSPYVVREPALATLASEIEARGALEPQQAVAWTLEVCEALAEAHALGMAHGDVRPETVCLARNEDGQPVAKLAWTTKAKAERAAQEDVARDIEGVGWLLRYLLTGSTDAEADNARTLPNELSYAVARATTNDVDARFKNIGELASTIARWAPPEHEAARNISFILSRAGMMSAPPAAPISTRSPAVNPLPPPTKPVMSQLVDHDDDRWFSARERTSLPSIPPPRKKGSTFAIVSLILLALVIGGTIFLTKTNKLPQWSGSAPVLEKDPQIPEPVGRTELTGAEVGDTTNMTPPPVLTAEPPKPPPRPMFEMSEPEPAQSITPPPQKDFKPEKAPKKFDDTMKGFDKSEPLGPTNEKLPAPAQPTAPAETEEPSSTPAPTTPTSPFIEEPPNKEATPSEPPTIY